MQKYLFVMASEGHPWGGSELLWSSAAAALVLRGHEVRISAKCWGRPIPEIERLRLVGCKIHYRKDKSLRHFVERQARKVLPVRDYRLTHLLKAGHEVDLVVISQGSNDDGLVWMEAAQTAGLKYVAIAHSAVVYWWPNDDLAKRLAASYEKACAAYFVARANLELSRLQFCSPLQNCKIVRNPFNVNYDVKCPWPITLSDELSLASVGRLDVISKGQDVLLKVLSLPHWRSRGVSVSLIGKGPHERALRCMVDAMGLTKVRFLGHLENVEDIWRNHHALVLASRFEGIPLVLVEAMLCARPSIVTDVGGIRELVNDGVNGFLAKAPTVELLDEAMNRAWESRSRLREMGNVAAVDVRHFVGRDPGDEFARELMTIADGAASK